ncbi:hypothetical protein [Rodentibacter pneumotropicus]|uniref:Uncharacterized protein n=1 Tax=Rodentibacter pneumotropicus TaxID=758 RepID=A0A4S2QBG2_9PAST|nr:hypothetical protein [Rodentibacter pneumotropicus]NBH76358.1 hypothetical protein [Rodentibacter pneumotropicus]THA04127.1 hypothetical protein D3M73_10500 [Rodentibacter pneumotropicus]THA10725.1 hypothetical protein D3M81_10170 [Rodentibacter pneumotropicus]THA14258.1 hypothetical protein D3M76_08010 [Rodentibacter pneumotropicus]
MTKSSQYLFFAQEYCEKHQLNDEQIKELAIKMQSFSVSVKDTSQPDPQLREIFAQWRQACQSKHAQTPAPNRDLNQLLQELSQVLALDKQAEYESDQAVLELIKVYFQSDRSPYELLKLSNRLFNLGQAYIKNGK